MTHRLIQPLLGWLCVFGLLSCGGTSHKKQVLDSRNFVQLGDNLSEKELLEASVNVLPSQRQYDWQRLEFIAFVHFGINTFTGREWGSGKETPKDFTPSALDADQWVQTIKSAGMKMVMLTAKHHDGFCLWPTATTPHSVKHSPWKDGHGDVLKEVADACHRHGLKLGIYVSPADLSEIEREGGTYGNGSAARKETIPAFGAPIHNETTFTYDGVTDYDAVLLTQLYEVCSNYGEVSEIWFDGANPKPGTSQTYNYDAWYDLIRKLQPKAVIAIKGPDVRWCGNEAGRTRDSEFSVVPTNEKQSVASPTVNDLGSRNKLKGAKYLHWYPAETNTSIRHGWFYRDDNQYVKSPLELLDVWYRSVGGNSVFLLNVTPNREGLIPAKDSTYLAKLGSYIHDAFANNVLDANDEIKVNGAMKGYEAKHLMDGDTHTAWQSEGSQGSIEMMFDQPKRFNRLVLQEDIYNLGQRVERFSVSYDDHGSWKTLYEGTTVGYKRICVFKTIATRKLRIDIPSSRVTTTLSEVAAYLAPEILDAPKISRDKDGMVKIDVRGEDTKVYYTVDGSEPTVRSKVYRGAFPLCKGGEVKAIATINSDQQKSEVVSQRYDLCASGWKVVASDKAQPNYEASKAIDGSVRTMWHTPWGEKVKGHPHFMTVDMGQVHSLVGLTYIPRQDGSKSGICSQYQFEVSMDGDHWTVVKKDRFDNIENNPVKQRIMFNRTKARYFRFTSLAAIDNISWISASEIGVVVE
ncbi:alpha-L-fucosidase [Prolixibacteraceae bacterium]|nr:alpha-L-fucosidase [Prolixibacteraceae bacterium]